MNIRAETMAEGSRSSPLVPASAAGGNGAGRTDPLSRSLPEIELHPFEEATANHARLFWFAARNNAENELAPSTLFGGERLIPSPKALL